LINAHGIAHPRFFGCAHHVGVLSGTPTIGVASHILCGQYDSEALSNNENSVPLMFHNRQVGWVHRSHSKNKPIFISPGQ
jgi:deoxyribonuclease V